MDIVFMVHNTFGNIHTLKEEGSSKIEEEEPKIRNTKKPSNIRRRDAPLSFQWKYRSPFLDLNVR